MFFVLFCFKAKLFHKIFSNGSSLSFLICALLILQIDRCHRLVCTVCVCVLILSVSLRVFANTHSCAPACVDVCMLAVGSLAPVHYIFMRHAV